MRTIMNRPTIESRSMFSPSVLYNLFPSPVCLPSATTLSVSFFRSTTFISISDSSPMFNQSIAPNSTHTLHPVKKADDKSTLLIVEQHMSIYGPFILTTLGIVGNILSILIFLSPRYRRQSSHFYLLSLAICDLCFLIINLFEDTLRNHDYLNGSRVNILDRSTDLICVCAQYARNTTRLLSSWIIVSFTIERLLVVFYPLKRASICRRKIARLVVTLLFLLSLSSNINVPFHYGILAILNHRGEPDTICDVLLQYRPIYMRFAIISMISVYLLPMCIIGIVNMLICSRLWRKSLLITKDGDAAASKQK